MEVEGKVTFAHEGPDGFNLELSGRTGHVNVKIPADAGFMSSALLGQSVRATGFDVSALTLDGDEVLGTLLSPGHEEIEVLEPHPEMPEISETNAANLPLLVNAAEIHRLNRDEAQRGIPS